MANENFIISFFDRIQDNVFLRTKRGLFFIIISLYFILSCLIKPFTEAIHNNILSAIVISIYILYWLYFSGRLFFSSKIKILFAIDYSEEAKSYSKQIERTINSQIDELNLSRSIKIINMPSDFIISDRTKAERYVKRRMIDLLVWGYTLEGKLQESKVSEFKLKFTYLYRILPERVKVIFIKQIESSLKGKYWRILDEKSFMDIQVVSTNITEVSLFVIGLCLYVRGDLEKSLNIFEKLKISLSSKNETDFPSISVIKDQIDSYLVEGYRFIGERLRERIPRESKLYFEKLLSINPNDSGAHLNIAKLCYTVDGDLNAARMHTDKVTAPHLRPLTNYNYAFFAILEKNPLKVLRYYQRIRAHPSENIIDILSFLENEFLKDPTNILFHFALGYINIYHGDVNISIEEIKKFIEKAKHISEYEELVKNATLLVKSREKRRR